MLHYESFELAVLQQEGEGYKKWEHLLPLIPADFRVRYLQALKANHSLPQAYDLVMATTTVPDKHYELLLQLAKKHPKKESAPPQDH